MSYDDFLKDLKDNVNVRIEDYPKSNKECFSLSDGDKKTKENKKISIYEEYSLGGEHGGNCWGDEPSAYISSGDEDRTLNIDEILEKYCPDIPYLQYKKILKLIKSYEYTEYEYYGNYTDYLVKYIIIEDLYNFLKNL